MNTEEAINMKMGSMQLLEFWARFFAWVGAFILLTNTIWEIIRSSNSLISISYWIFPIAVYITGIFDIYRNIKKRKATSP
jgi:hypothetical protein